MIVPRFLPAATLTATLAVAAHAAVPPLDVRTVRTTSADMPMVYVYLINQGTEPIDSLSVRIFLDARDTLGTHDSAGTTVPALFSRSVAALPDLCQFYEASGFNRACSDTLHGGSKVPWGKVVAATSLLDPLPAGNPDAQGRRPYAIDLLLPPLLFTPGRSVLVTFLLRDRENSASILSQALRDSAAGAGGALMDRSLPLEAAMGWWSLEPSATRVPDLRQSWSFRAHEGLLAPDTAATPSDADQLIQRAATNPWVVVRRKGVAVWGYAPDGSGPGLPAPTLVPDSILALPYAPIATPPVAGVPGRVLDSQFVNFSRVRVNQAGYRLQDVAAGRARIRAYGPETSYQLLRVDAAEPPRNGDLNPAYGPLSASLQAKRMANVQTTLYTLSTDPSRRIANLSLQEGVLPTDLPKGRWKVVVGTDTSQAFVVSDSVYTWVRDAAIRFLGVQRSGDSSWFHGPSHMSDGSFDTVGVPEAGAARGGWYDAGDYLKEGQTMASTLVHLAAFAALHPDRDPDHWGAVHRVRDPLDGMGDLRREARFGAEFFLRSWKRNGYSTGVDTSRHLEGMVTSVADFGKDHSRWTLADLDEATFGTDSRIVRRELGANTIADVAAALAFLSGVARPSDSLWADTALMAAREMYAYAKAHLEVVSSPAYSGVGPDKLDANLGLAAVALWWAANDSAFLREAVYDKAIGTHGQVGILPNSSFEGGWFVRSNQNLFKASGNQDWAHRHALALHAFARILLDAPSAGAIGVRSEAERKLLLTRAVVGIQRNLAALSSGQKGSFLLPNLESGNNMDHVGGDTLWGLLGIQQVWEASGYMAGNAAELLMYADIVRDLNAGKLGGLAGAGNFPADPATSLALRQLDFILGQNILDASLVMGVGGRNLHHPHHRGSTDEGSWTTRYEPRVPVGALIGGPGPLESTFVDDVNDYRYTESTINSSAQLLWATSLLVEPGSIPTASISPSRSAWRPELALRSRPGFATVFAGRLPAGTAANLEILDASGRILSSRKVVADSKGMASAEFDRPGSGLLIARVRAAGSQTSRTFVAP